MQRWRQSGFTLVELMVTLAVAVILATLAIPSFVEFIKKSRLRGATDDVVSLLNTSRATAVKLQRQINVSMKGSASSWCAGAFAETGPSSAGAALALGNSTCNCSAGAGNCLVDNQNALVSSSSYSGVSLTSASSDIAYASATSGGVIFNPKFGALTNSSGDLLSTTPSIILASGRYSTQITVSPLGQVVVCVPSSSPFIAGYSSC